MLWRICAIFGSSNTSIKTPTTRSCGSNRRRWTRTKINVRLCDGESGNDQENSGSGKVSSDHGIERSLNWLRHWHSVVNGDAFIDISTRSQGLGEMGAGDQPADLTTIARSDSRPEGK